MHEETAMRRVVRYELSKRLLELRGGDVKAMIDQLAGPSLDNELVAVRDLGREAIKWDPISPASSEGRIESYRIKRNGRLADREVLWMGEDVEEWLKAHRDELEWAHPKYRFK